MNGLLIRWLLNAVALLITANLVNGLVVNDFLSAFVAAIVLGIVNAVIKPVVLILTLPLNIVTLGLFTLVINAMMLWIVSAVVSGFQVNGFWSTIFAALVLSIISGLLSSLIKDKN